MKTLCRALALLTVFAALVWADARSDARALSERGLKALRAKDFPTAADLLRRAAKLDPRNAYHLANLALAEANLGNDREALAAVEKAITVDARVPWFHVNAALFAQRAGDHAKAARYSKSALAFGRAKLGAASEAMMKRVQTATLAGPFIEKAKAAEKKGDFKEAAAQQEKAREIAPEDPLLLAYLSYYQHQIGQHETGLAHAEKAIALDGQVSAYWVTAANHAAALGQFDRATKYARKALTFEPPNLGAANARLMRDFLDSLRPRTYTVTWKVGKGGPVHVPLPTTGLPYQEATYAVKGAASHKEITRDGERLLRLERDGTREIELTATVTVRFHDYRPAMAAAKKGAYPKEALAYLGDGPHIDLSSRKVRDLAAKLKGDSPAATVRNVLAWLKEHLTYERLPFDRVDDVIARGKGECAGYSAVFVALCRSAGVPAREVWGVTKTTPRFAPAGHLAGHIWAEVYVVGVGWVPVEPQEPHSFGHHNTGSVRMTHQPPTARAWPAAERAAWVSLGALTPKYGEKPADRGE